MSTVIFFMLPEAGHLNPSFKLAKTLQRRGHRVCYFSVQDWEDYIRAQGFTCFPLFQGALPKGSLTSPEIFKKDEEWLKDQDAFEHLIADQGKIINNSRREIIELAESIQPDLFIIDVFLPVAALLAYRLGVQSIFLNPGFNVYHHFFEGELAPLQKAPELVLCPQELDLPRTQKPNHLRYCVEPSIDLERSGPPFPWDRLVKDKPLIYCALGSQCDVYGAEGDGLFRALVEAMVVKENWQLVMTVGPGDIDPPPQNVITVRNAPQLELLKRASIMITHGGIGSVKECIFFGVPMIVFPLRIDQPRNAARVIYHGLGVRGDVTRVSAEMIHSLIDKIDRNPHFKANVEAMGKRFRAMEGSERGSKIIERVLDSLREKAANKPAAKTSEESLNSMSIGCVRDNELF